ncbi:MAG TPA: DNA recombination protein RmuC [Daejeonella sp.]|uniref:DNA recombination protein RmuC n=1 Tax=Daejeonella sp. TaxID=2805397 RepID=UPI0026CA8B34|nr:DNA recombination protein RmuC [Daejeonella sp.]HQS50864.1 DNA recombination protein RmuC [Daejeonella sp.]HQT22129.1 DNA recombination protein RmuC [Daejeonella sp.]HQT57436.1 DNA recombination protein RmuC [Daejeonella sp.]
MEIYILPAAAIIIAVLFILLRAKPKSGIAVPEDFDHLKSENEQLKISLAKAEERAENLRTEQEYLKKELNTEREKLSEALRSLESSRAYLQAQQEKIDEQKSEIKNNQEKFNKDFELIASRILEEKSVKFTEHSRANLDLIIKPLRENLKTFEDKVDKVYKAESDERNILRGHINQLIEQSNLMNQETKNLTRALKGDSKKQGNWGELILERVLERSGLVKDQEYRIQASHQSSDGGRFQPDVVIDLPDDKHLIIDAKVSLTAYERLVNCESDEDRNLFTKQHIASIRNHIIELSSKNYSELYKINSPDFVMLFIPIESSFSIAVQHDAELFNFAWEKHVVIVSPSTLLATLRTIASMWKQERQNRNVMEIARLSGEMYDKFIGFMSDMEGIGKNIKQSQDAYDKAINKLSSGRGNLSTTAEKIKKLGARTGKQLDQKFISEDDD